MTYKERVSLWAHVVSQHATIMPPDFPIRELKSFHHREHHGPCGIRNHAESDRTYTLSGIAQVLKEDG